MISLASWKKYPNPARPDVLHIDLVKRELDPNTGILYTTRLVAIKSFLPSWLERLFGYNPRLYFVEEAMIDPKNHKMILKSKSLSFSSIIKMEEQCKYVPHPQNSKWTLFEHQGKVTASPLGISRKIEDFCAQTFRQNATNGREIMEQAIAKIKQEKLLMEERLSRSQEIRDDFNARPS